MQVSFIPAVPEIIGPVNEMVGKSVTAFTARFSGHHCIAPPGSAVITALHRLVSGQFHK